MLDKPLLFVNVDGVVSPWGSGSNERPAEAFHNVDGIIHFLSSGAGVHLLALSLPGRLPFLSCSRNPARARARRELGAIEAHAGRHELEGRARGVARRR
jgi:hypothetical protein